MMRQVRRGAAPPPGPGQAAPQYAGGVPQQPSYVDGQGHDGYDSGY
ncbi:LytR family transcriptional regulator, partial [Streptomyces sp. SID5910]|nr:LytR family transcriptional regulator [Streptomyces sp. SID5910]